MSDDRDNVLRLDRDRVLVEAGGPVDESSATLCIYGHDLDPDDLTRRLGLQPTEAFRRGFQRRPTSRPMAHGAWFFRVSEPPPSTVDDQLGKLLLQLVVPSEVWARVVEEFRVRVSVGLHMSCWNRGFTLTPTVLAAMAQLGVELDFDIYAYLDEDGE